MKKVIPLILGLTLLIGMAYMYFFQFHLWTELKDDTVKVKMLKEEQPQDSVLGESLVDGKTIYKGGPYRLGETVFVRDTAVTVESVGFVNDLKETGATHNQSHAVFRLTLRNYGEQPYRVSEKDLSLKYQGEDNILHDQPLSLSGYNGWKKVKGSFIFEEIPSNTQREGLIFLPAKKDALVDGTVKVFIHNVPVEFKY